MIEEKLRLELESIFKKYKEIEEVNTPLSFDILNFNELTKEKLIENIKNEGIIIYKG